MIAEKVKAKLTINNPATGEILKEVAADTGITIANKFVTAKEAQSAWSKQPLKARIETIAAFDKLLEKNIAALALTLTREVGKPIKQSHNEINGARKRIKFFLENSEKWLS